MHAQAFWKEKGLKDTDIESCGNVDLSALHIDLKENVVRDSLKKENVPIECGDHRVEFHGQKWDIPGVDVGPAVGLDSYSWYASIHECITDCGSQKTLDTSRVDLLLATQAYNI